MDAAIELSDPSDWNSMVVPSIGLIDAALRCHICKDFFTTPMITSCSHTFCSLCIRRCLTDDGVCPVCRSPDQMSRLKLNATVQEIVETFQAIRLDLLSACENINLPRSGPETRNGTAQFNSAEYHSLTKDCNPLDSTSHQKRALSQCCAVGAAQCSKCRVGRSIKPHTNVNEDTGTVQPPPGFARCPICSIVMLEEKVFSHLDIHNKTVSKSEGPQQKKCRVGYDTLDVFEGDRLAQINYSLLKDTALRKKLSDAGIPTHGLRTQLINRHTEWVNLWNSNCDSLSPRTKKELLRELSVWDKAQTGPKPSIDPIGGTIMSKDFDGRAWAGEHQCEYKSLTAQALKSKPKRTKDDE